MGQVDILMATYNGANYIESQLLSLISQSYRDWKLLIHDDGSNDDTLAIVDRYAHIDDRIKVIDDGIRFGNAADNFLHLLQLSNSPHVVFCDQDDIWFENKLKILYESIHHISSPMAVYCNAYAYDGVKITAEKVSLIERHSLNDSLFLNSGVQGCSLMFNRTLIDILVPFPDYVCMHDHLLTMATITFGKLKYIDESMMLYRQHSSNVTGNVATSFKQRAKNFLNSENTIIDRNHYNANLAFFDRYKNKMSADQVNIFRAYLNFPSYGLVKKIFTILKFKFRVSRSPFILILKLFVKKTI